MDNWIYLFSYYLQDGKSSKLTNLILNKNCKCVEMEVRGKNKGIFHTLNKLVK